MSFECCLQTCRNYSNFQSFNEGGKTRNFHKSQSQYKGQGGSSELFQVPETIQGENARNFSKSQSL